VQTMFPSCNKSSPGGRFLRYSHRIVAAVLLIGGLAAQTREHKVQSIFYHSSPDDPRVPTASPVAIRPAAATPVPAARPPAPAGTFHRWGGTEHNSRLQYHVKGSSDQAKWQVELPSHFSPTGVLADGGRVVVEGSNAWWLVDASSRRGLEQGQLSVGEVVLDPARQVFYAPNPHGYLAAYSLSDGHREFFLTPFFGEEFNRALVERHERRVLIISVERRLSSHADIVAHRSVAEVWDLAEPSEVSESGRLKSANRADYLMGEIAHLLSAVHGNTLALATDDNVFLADFDLKLQRQFTGKFHPLFLSIDEVPRLYVIVRVESGLELWVLSQAGDRILRWSMPSGFEASAPPVVGFDHTVYLIGQHRLVAIDSSGAIRWDQVEDGEVAGAGINPEGNLIVAAGANLVSYDAAGKRTRLFSVPDDVLVTAPATDEKGDILVAGRRRLYCLP
jgi:hypothetical protein